MNHSKKVTRIVRIMERQYFLHAKANAIADKIKPRLDRIAVRFNRPIERLQAKINALQTQRDEKLGAVRGAERVLKLREQSHRLEHDIKVRVAGLNGGEAAALGAAKSKLAEAAHNIRGNTPCVLSGR